MRIYILWATSSASTLNGEIIVTKLAMTPGFDFGAYLERSTKCRSALAVALTPGG